MKNGIYFINTLLGDDFVENLTKSELWHQNSKTTSDVYDVVNGLKIVPKAILALLIKELTPMEINEHKEFDLPIDGGCKIDVTKVDKSAYSGQIFQDNKKITDFISRTIPSLGIVIMSLFELYDLENLNNEEVSNPEINSNIQKLIDDRINLHSLVNQVVDGKLMHRDAVQQLYMAKLNEELAQEKNKKEVKIILPLKEEIEKTKKGSPLKDFVENRKKKLEKKEHFIQLEKSETILCTDCGQTLFSEGVYSGCICFGESNKKIHIKKTEGGYSVCFGRGWDIDNITMLLEVLRSKTNGQ